MKLSSHFLIANLSTIIWINLFYVTGYLFVSKVFPAYSSGLIDALLKVNALSFVGFAIGNKTGVSDLLTITSKILRYIAMITLFSVCIMLVYGLFTLFSYFYPSSLTGCIAFAIALLTWIFSITQQKHSSL
jgi:hypothetical protein